jgi:redox-sensitive bicupin YhaK (pirin superfamily)
LNGVKGPAKTFTPVNVFDLRLEAGGTGKLILPVGHNSAIVLLRGEIVVNRSSTLKGSAQMALLSTFGETVLMEAKAQSLVLVLSGEPINEPVASYGPFVMNTQAEIRQAAEDYRAGKMGRV